VLSTQLDDRWAQRGIETVAAEISNCAALGSIIVGTASTLDRDRVSSSLASSGFLGAVKETASGCTFSCQQQRPSLLQEGTYLRHVQAAEEADEDFFDNFS
jgi:hypothetical protein